MSNFSDINLDKISNQHKEEALKYILEAWECASETGISSSNLSTASIFVALCDLVDNYGEDAVASMTRRLSSRIVKGDFSINSVDEHLN